jgi:beta-glucuronidase
VLYPQQNQYRNLMDLSGVWDFQTDPTGCGEDANWMNFLPAPRPLAVPGSWNEQYGDLYDYLGAGWYQRTFYVPAGWRGQTVSVRVGSANYAAQVWLNGVKVGIHEGGHLPFAFEINTLLNWNGANILAIRVENELKPTRVPAGNVNDSVMNFMGGFPNATFDFYPYAGLHRPVVLCAVPQVHIEDVVVTTGIEGNHGLVECYVRLSDASDPAGGEAKPAVRRGRVRLSGEGKTLDAALVFIGGEAHALLPVDQAHLWSPEDPFLYQADFCLLGADGTEVDRYGLAVGIRTVEVRGDQLLLNGAPVVLTGFGRHEDFYISGRGLNLPLIVRDYDLMKWVGANSYRTSHYPYSEEEMMMADRQGMLIIDEIPAVSLQFGDSSENQALRLEVCQQQLRDLVARDRNHPAVIMWSVANEPMPPDMLKRLAGGGEPGPAEIAGHDFLKTLVDLAHSLDKTRPATLVGVMGGPVEWLNLGDVLCINRYWGWYTLGGQLETAFEALAQELDGLHEKLGKALILTEFGADTVAGMHAQPARMFTEEYQAEFLRGYLDVAASRPFVVGLHVWNFADFQATQSIMRVGGMNMKGVFTRERKPKLAAHILRERWTRPRPTLLVNVAKAADTAEQPASPNEFALNSSVSDPVLMALSKVAERLSGKHPGVTRTVGFHLEDEGVYRLVIENGTCRAEAGDGPADATIQLKAKDAVRLMSGELNPMVAVMTGRVKVSGDLKALAILQSIQ